MTAAAMYKTFRALGDPTREQIIDWLAAGESITATEVATRLPITRQAVTRHLATLTEGGLIAGTRYGREYRYTLIPEQIEQAARWLRRRSASWDQALGQLADHLNEDAGETS